MSCVPQTVCAGASTALPPPQVDFSQSVSHLWRQFKVRGNTADAATGQMANSGGGGGPPGAGVGGGSGCYNCGEPGECLTILQTRRWCYYHHFVNQNFICLLNLLVMPQTVFCQMLQAPENLCEALLDRRSSR